jgi:hypothetical protein
MLATEGLTVGGGMFPLKACDPESAGEPLSVAVTL